MLKKWYAYIEVFDQIHLSGNPYLMNVVCEEQTFRVSDSPNPFSVVHSSADVQNPPPTEKEIKITLNQKIK